MTKLPNLFTKVISWQSFTFMRLMKMANKDDSFCNLLYELYLLVFLRKTFQSVPSGAFPVSFNRTQQTNELIKSHTFLNDRV